jgi:hypothetical protein
MPIGLQEWIMMMTKISKVMMNDTTTIETTKPKTNLNNTDKSRNNSNKLILTRLTTSSKMQDKTSIRTCVKETIRQQQLDNPAEQHKTVKSLQEGRLVKPDRLNERRK